MIILDATVVVKLLVEEPGGVATLARIESENERVAPAWLRLEVSNALIKKVRRDELAPELVPMLLRSVDAIVTEMIDPLPLLDRAMHLALQARHAVYDCLYLALAVERESVLITHDGKLMQAAQRLGLEEHLELLS